MPAGYELVRVDWKLAGVLRLWRNAWTLLELVRHG